jgi:hypothetical protein
VNTHPPRIVSTQVTKVVGAPLAGKVVKKPKLKMQEMENINTALKCVPTIIGTPLLQRVLAEEGRGWPIAGHAGHYKPRWAPQCCQWLVKADRADQGWAEAGSKVAHCKLA